MKKLFLLLCLLMPALAWADGTPGEGEDQRPPKQTEAGIVDPSCDCVQGPKPNIAKPVAELGERITEDVRRKSQRAEKRLAKRIQSYRCPRLVAKPDEDVEIDSDDVFEQLISKANIDEEELLPQTRSRLLKTLERKTDRCEQQASRESRPSQPPPGQQQNSGFSSILMSLLGGLSGTMGMNGMQGMNGMYGMQGMNPYMSMSNPYMSNPYTAYSGYGSSMGYGYGLGMSSGYGSNFGYGGYSGYGSGSGYGYGMSSLLSTMTPAQQAQYQSSGYSNLYGSYGTNFGNGLNSSYLTNLGTLTPAQQVTLGR